jgi:hypothetical protein
VPTSAALDEDMADIPLAEVLHLCMSSSPRQRSAMLQILARRLRSLSMTPGGAAGIRAQAWPVGEAALLGREGVEVARSGVELLWEIVVGSEDEIDGSHLEDEEEHLLPVGLRAHPKDAASIIPRLANVVPLLVDRLATPTFTPKTLHQILAILLVLAALPSPMPATLLDPLPQSPLLHALAKSLLSARPDPLALSLLVALVRSSREVAKLVWESNSGVGGAVLRFVASPPSTPNESALARGVLDLFAAWAEYGFASSSCADAADLWRALGAAIHSAVRPPPHRPAYYRLLTRWTVCAINPHVTSPEHDITWSQIGGMAWFEDLLAILPAAVKGREPGLPELLDFTQAWLEGSAVNEPSQGADVRARLGNVLTQEAVESLVSDVGSRLATALAGETQIDWPIVIRLVQLLLPVINVGAKLFPLVSWSSSSISLLDSLYLTLLAATPASFVHRRRTNALLAALHVALPQRQDWLAKTHVLLSSLVPGDEPLAQRLMADMLLTPLPSLLEAASLPTSLADAVTHRFGLAILEPFYRFAVSPAPEAHASPLFPGSATLKDVTSLRIPSRQTVSFHPKTPAAYPKSRCGLPLAVDWDFAPLDELLHSTSSGAFVTCPPDWDASETELVQAALLFALVKQAVLAPIGKAMDVTATLYECAKVIQLEQNVLASDMVGGAVKDPEGAEVYRDSSVERLMRALLDPLRVASHPPPSTTDLEQYHASLALSAAPPPPFFYLYSDLHALYASTSFGHPLFARLLLPPLGLGMPYAVDYRRLFWADENLSLLRGITLAPADAVLERPWSEWLGRVGESDPMVLQGYVRALVRDVTVARNPLLYALALHNLATTIWSPSAAAPVEGSAPSPSLTAASATPLTASTSAPSPSALVKLVVSALPPSVVKDIVLYASPRASGEGWDGVRDADRAERLTLVAQWAGELGARRLMEVGLDP